MKKLFVVFGIVSGVLVTDVSALTIKPIYIEKGTDFLKKHGGVVVEIVGGITWLISSFSE